MAPRPTWIPLLLPLAWGAACAPGTAVVVRLEADEGAAGRASGLRVRLCDNEGDLELDGAVELGEGAGGGRFPIAVEVVPRNDDPARRFWLVAELLASRGYPVSRQRAEGGFVGGERLEHRLRFDEPCWGVLACLDGETCTRGACLDARLPPLPPGSPGAPLPPPCRSPALPCPAVEGEAGTSHGCAVSTKGALWCWGDNGAGQVGLEGEPLVPAPALVEEAGPWLGVAAGDGHSCAVGADRSLWCWGGNVLGALGLGDHGEGTDRARPVRLEGEDDWSSVVAGGHSCGIRGSGELWCWGGENLHGELGVATEGVVDGPTRVGAGWAQVSVGPTRAGRHTCGVRLDGTLWCWGANERGQLGVGDREDHAPIRVPLDARAALVAVGDEHVCAAGEAGELWCWGRNDSGQLGVGSAGEDRLEPTRLALEADWVGLAAGSAHGCAVARDGGLWCWGAGSAGQLGTGERGDRSEPAPVTTGRAVRRVWAGAEHSCAVDDEGALSCWGSNAGGQLGVGGSREELAPAPLCGAP